MSYYDEPGDNDNYNGPEVHTFDPDPVTGKCRGGWARGGWGEWIACNSTQRESVLHDDEEAAHRQAHDHGGGDCMCFEDDPDPTDDQLLRDSESIGSGGARDSDPSYRSEMRDAGRGALLR